MPRCFPAWFLVMALLLGGAALAEPPAGYAGRSFGDAFHKADPARIPGLLQCAVFDLGGEGVA